jgi:hypothetical protein
LVCPSKKLKPHTNEPDLLIPGPTYMERVGDHGDNIKYDMLNREVLGKMR